MPAIAIPFYLAHPRLKTLELHQMMEVEGGTPEWCAQLLRHECGHAVDHAYRFSVAPQVARDLRQPRRRLRARDVPASPLQQSFVRHLPNWYAQAHPDEDFAETFAVWLGSPAEEWRARYRGWKALEKLEYVDALMTRGARASRPRCTAGRRRGRGRRRCARRWRATTPRAASSGRRTSPASTTPTCGASSSSAPAGHGTAAAFMRRRRKAIVARVVRWTGQRKYVVDDLARKLCSAACELGLHAPADEVALALDVGAYLASLVTNHLYTGRFKRSVVMRSSSSSTCTAPSGRTRRSACGRCAREEEKPTEADVLACLRKLGTRSRRWRSTTT